MPECHQLSTISISIATSQNLFLTLPHSHVRRHEVAMKRIGTSKIVLASLGGPSPEQGPTWAGEHAVAHQYS